MRQGARASLGALLGLATACVTPALVLSHPVGFGVGVAISVAAGPVVVCAWVAVSARGHTVFEAWWLPIVALFTAGVGFMAYVSWLISFDA